MRYIFLRVAGWQVEGTEHVSDITYAYASVRTTKVQVFIGINAHFQV